MTQQREQLPPSPGAGRLSMQRGYTVVTQACGCIVRTSNSTQDVATTWCAVHTERQRQLDDEYIGAT